MIRKAILLGGLALLIGGAAVLVFGPGQGRIRLVNGISGHKLLPGHPGKPDSVLLDFSLVLDSIRADAMEPELSLLVWAIDTAGQSHSGQATPYSGLVDAFPLDTMVIRPIGKTDHRFRLVRFYPDFTFRYTYPEEHLGDPPRSPGITLSLITPDGEGITTLRTDQPGKDKLDDLVDLGCHFMYAWRVSEDSLRDAVSRFDQPLNQVLFSGVDRRIYYLFEGKLTADSLAVGKSYVLPGRSEPAFSIVVHFPDATYLQAEPATASHEANRPVAQVELWKKGGRSTELFLYPNTQGRAGGDHRIPGTNALLTLAENPVALLRRSDIYLRAGAAEAEADPILLSRGNGLIYNGKYIKPLSCHPDYPGSVILSVHPLRGLWMAVAGLGLVALAAFLRLRKRGSLAR